jgi:HEAT repeats
MDTRDWVRRLADNETRLAAMRALVGGVNASELRDVRLSEEALCALEEGLTDPNPRIRWWCVQLLDHVPDPRSLDALTRALSDEVPRVRRNAAHALGCVACKPDWGAALPREVVSTLAEMATNDPNEKVRHEARMTLSCR